MIVEKDRRIKIHKRYVPLFQQLRKAGITEDHQQLFVIAFAIGIKEKKEIISRENLYPFFRAIVLKETHLDFFRTALYSQTEQLYLGDDLLTKTENYVGTGLDFLTSTILQDCLYTAENDTVHVLPGKEFELLITLIQYVKEESEAVPF